MADIKSGFSEAQYQSFIESCFLSDFRGNNEFDIHYFSGTSERLRGYDIRIDTYIPLFLQMKRSDFYYEHSNNVDMRNRKNTLSFIDNPGAYTFHLHVDSVTKDYLQHNLLVDLSNDFNYVRYIAPNFVRYGLLMKLKYSLETIYWDTFHDNRMSYGTNTIHWRDYLYFPHSILIKPHARQTKVARVHHKYFFNRKRQISFHSEPKRIENGESFQEFISNVNATLNSNKNEHNKSLEQIFNVVKSTVLKNLVENDAERQSENSLRIENEFVESNIVFDEFMGLEKLEYSIDNFIILTNYLDKRFGIRTLLAGEKQFNFNEI